MILKLLCKRLYDLKNAKKKKKKKKIGLHLKSVAVRQKNCTKRH